VAERPQLRVALEHTGWPLGVDETSYEVWKGSMTEFARSTDAAVKLSGLAMVTREISAASMGPWIECCIGLFGWDRVVFGSNFPLDGLVGSYEELLRVFDEVLKSARTEQLEKLFAANAERIYRV
jgi:L-fuconolactonase